MGITVIPQLIFRKSCTEPEITVEQLRKKGLHYRHPDSATISYPRAVDLETPLGSIGKSLNIAVVGGGISGIACIYELSKLPNADKNINVTLFESDYEHFTVADASTGNVDTYGQRAGRVFTGVSKCEYDQGTLSVYEIGAMRFPEIAGLTWHYASVVFGNATVSMFHNPGQVPTEFVYGERTDRYKDENWSNPSSPTRILVSIINKALTGNKESNEENVGLFPIGGKDPAKISQELKSEHTTSERLQEIKKEWEIFANKYDELTLGSAIRQVIRKNLDDLPDIPGLPSGTDYESTKLNYYVGLFGRFGFGIGGYRSLFNVSLVEMMRELLWEYSTEYKMPADENVKFPSGLYAKAKEVLVNLRAKRARVCDVCHLDDERKATSAAVVYYKINEKGVEEELPKLETFDYVILAVTPKQLSAMTSRLGFQNVARHAKLGDYPKEYPDALNVRPPLILSDSDALNSQVLSAINQIHMMTSLKIFATIKQSTYDENAALFNGEKIQAIISDCGLASTYVVPSPLPSSKFYTFLLSYTWEDDSRSLQNELFSFPKNVADEDEQNQVKNRKMLNQVINRTNRDVVDPTDQQNPKCKRWWFGELLKKADKNGELINALSYDWTTHHTSGAFKNDLTGDYHNNHFLFRYHTHALKSKTLQNRFFLANDSYTHMGGWMEGALMGAVNAVCGLIVAANDGDVSALAREEARKVMTDLKPVV